MATMAREHRSVVEALQNGLIEGLRAELRARGYSPRTEEAYCYWARRFQQLVEQDPAKPVDEHAVSFLGGLRARDDIAASTQNQAASALVFVFKDVLGLDAEWSAEVARQKRSRPTPTVLTREEVLRILDNTSGVFKVVGAVIYGSGLRLLECLQLRVHDVNVRTGEVIVRAADGSIDRTSCVPAEIRKQVGKHLEGVRQVHVKDRQNGGGYVHIGPPVFGRPAPSTSDWHWQYVFPSSRPTLDPTTGHRGRSHVHSTAVQRAIAKAVRASGVTKKASCQTLRHSYAAHLLDQGWSLDTVRKLLGHKDPRSTQAYTQI